MQLLQFPDKCVSYQTFVHDVAAQVAFFMKADRNDLERISKNKAFSMFGRGNVERWRDKGRLTVCKRPGKVEYLTAELRYCQWTQQDYF
ncbi:hypothetical protein [uncultured Duncaniella sp.]|uniref:hypothetical protein n=1 Tax=uncultured Duncaniella sp. TaxID=2768039 RepID=UPI0025B26115|nr:hypothetical protein [uncultured Duncaniella sp.]